MSELSFHFTYEPDNDEQRLIEDFFGQLEDFPPEHNAKWFKIANPNKKACLFYAKLSDKIVCYSLIKEHYKIATVFLGPLFSDQKQVIPSLLAIKKYFKQKGFAELLIQYGQSKSETTKQFFDELSTKMNFKVLDDASTWASLKLDLTKGYDAIYENYRRNHKRSLKKSENANLNIRLLENEGEVSELATIYDHMYNKRGISKDFPSSKEVFIDAWNYVKMNDNGIVLGVFDEGNKLLGGIINIESKESAYYRLSASRPEERDKAIIHKAIDESIKIAIDKKLKYFDFWGFNPKVTDNDQVSKINLFKLGFGGEEIVYPDMISVRLNILTYVAIKSAQWLKRKVKA